MDVPIATQVLETPQLTPTHDQVRVFFYDALKRHVPHGLTVLTFLR